MDLLPLIGTGAGVVVSLAGVMRWLLRDLRADLGGRMDRLETRMDQLEARLDGRMDRLETRLEDLAADLRTVSERLARVEGAVCGPVGLARSPGHRRRASFVRAGSGSFVRAEPLRAHPLPTEPPSTV